MSDFKVLFELSDEFKAWIDADGTVQEQHHTKKAFLIKLTSSYLTLLEAQKNPQDAIWKELALDLYSTKYDEETYVGCRALHRLTKLIFSSSNIYRLHRALTDIDKNAPKLKRLDLISQPDSKESKE